MTYVLVVWAITHMHVFAVKPPHPGADLYDNLKHCELMGEAIVDLWPRHNARFECVLAL